MYNVIKSLHLEVTNHCNAACLGCARTGDFAPENEDHLNSSWLSLSFISKILEDKKLTSLEKIFLCGNSGDPMAHPEIYSIVENIQLNFPQTLIVIDTNGSLGSKETWDNLGKISKGRRFKVRFSIDGLKDTNSLYRVGVDWHRISENTTTYIKSGGRAEWKFIVFPHNEHQVEMARTLANDMGFENFILKKNYDEKRVPTITSLKQIIENKKDANPYSEISDEKLIDYFSYLSQKEISCQSIEDKEIFIDAEGKLWPCCWIANIGLERRSFREREFFYRNFIEKLERDFNNLHKKSLNEVLQHDFFAHKLENSWTNTIGDKINPCLPTCTKQCGIK